MLRFIKKYFSFSSFSREVTGFTLIELLVAFVVMGIIFFVTTMFAADISEYTALFREALEVQQEVQLTLREVIPEVRAMSPSGNGAYAIRAAASSSFSFYTDTDNNGIVEAVRYFLLGTTLRKGIITPTGSPLVYNPATEVTYDVVHNMVVSTSSVFLYYDGAYTGTEAPLPFPVNIASIRMVKITLSAREPGQNAPITISIRLTPRNLRTNL